MSVQCVEEPFWRGLYCRLCSRAVLHSVCHRASKCGGTFAAGMKCQLSATIQHSPAPGKPHISPAWCILDPFEVRTLCSKNRDVRSVHPGRLYGTPQKAKEHRASLRSQCYQTKLGFKSFFRKLPSAVLPPVPRVAADPNRPSHGAARSPCPLPLPSAQPPACTESSATARRESSQAAFRSGRPDAPAAHDSSASREYVLHSPKLFRLPGISAPAPAPATAETHPHSARSKFQKIFRPIPAARDAPSAAGVSRRLRPRTPNQIAPAN